MQEFLQRHTCSRSKCFTQEALHAASYAALASLHLAGTGASTVKLTPAASTHSKKESRACITRRGGRERRIARV